MKVGELKGILANQVGDALTTGSPAYLQGSGNKWSESNYNQAISFATELVREMFLIPVHAQTTWPTNLSVYDISIAGPSLANIVYIYELLKETASGSGQFEKVIPLDLVTLKRTGSGHPFLHVDQAASAQIGVPESGAAVLVKGYMYPITLTLGAITGSLGGLDSLEVSVNVAAITLAAKMFLHQSGISRDPAELIKNMRQLEQTRALVEQFSRDVGTQPIDNGIWVNDA